MRPPDEADLQLINVLQAVPRAAWADIGPIIGLSPTAAAARWRRLTDEGVAWVAAYPASRVARPVTGLVELAVPAPAGDLAARLCRLAAVSGIDEVVGQGRLLVTIQVPDLAAFAAVERDLAGQAGVRVAATWVVTDVVRQGAEWRLDALDARQRAAVQALAARGAVSARRTVSPLAHLDPLIACLAEDPRMAVAEMARRLGRDPSTVRRQVHEVLASGYIRFRCDAATEWLGRPVTSIWVGRIPPADFDETVRALRSLPELRLGLVVAGDDNLLCSAFHRSLDGVSEFRRKLGRLAPGLAISKSMILLRSHKRSGWLLDGTGRRTGEYVRPLVLSADYLDS